eukprot:1690281-Karenia_brevis.AAC.1
MEQKKSKRTPPEMPQFCLAHGMRSEMKGINALNLEGPAIRCNAKIYTFAELTERHQQIFTRR